MVEQNEMEKNVTSMMEHLCDHLCRFPWEIERKEDLEEICAGCNMGQYVCDILNTYNSTTQLQAAAEVVRAELMQKGNWYNALTASIHGYMRGAAGSIPYNQMAEELASLIIGIEKEKGGSCAKNKCKNCGKSYTYLDTSCNWFARCDLLGTAQIVGACQGGDGESMCNCSDQEPPDWDCDLGRDDQYCIHHVDADLEN